VKGLAKEIKRSGTRLAEAAGPVQDGLAGLGAGREDRAGSSGTHR
jgi:hypothetical protein